MTVQTQKRGELAYRRQVILRLARRFRVRPSKRYSQNFLLDLTFAERAVRAAGCKRGDWVLEVGAGFGDLTDTILQTGADVTAFEIDTQLAAACAERFTGEERLTLIQDDFFHWFRENERTRAKRQYTIVANLPYHASSFFFECVLPSPFPPKRIVVMLQREVAQRIVAQPGSMSVLSLAVQMYGSPRVLDLVPRHAFWPEPAVDSALLVVENIKPPTVVPTMLFRIARAAFANRRKQIHNSIQAWLRCESGEILSLFRACGIHPTVRPQDLTLADWRRLAEEVSRKFPGVASAQRERKDR